MIMHNANAIEQVCPCQHGAVSDSHHPQRFEDEESYEPNGGFLCVVRCRLGYADRHRLRKR